jgi:hypothetical protein
MMHELSNNFRALTTYLNGQDAFVEICPRAEKRKEVHKHLIMVSEYLHAA